MRKKIYSGKIIDLYRYDIKIEGRKVRRDIIIHPGAAAIVAFDSDGKIILVKQNRFPHGYVLEVPAGTLEKGETPMQCAKRELLEETGYAVRRLKKLISYHPTIGASTEIIHCFVALDAKKVSSTKLDSDEFITVLKMDVNKLIHMIKTGKITDSKTICSVLVYATKNGLL
ncbi:MAG: NUDIX hydrolase [Cenarchaeum symbiont of Oopsacas minuta]|nr:NUDIX hydrolase [Cenarchaeum symbiont of Oopsacas minuta]